MQRVDGRNFIKEFPEPRQPIHAELVDPEKRKNGIGRQERLVSHIFDNYFGVLSVSCLISKIFEITSVCIVSLNLYFWNDEYL